MTDEAAKPAQARWPFLADRGAVVAGRLEIGRRGEV